MAYMDSADNAEGENGEAGKLTQEECNYRRGSPTEHCGVCVYYEGDATKSCSKVQGPISGFGISNVFKMQSNPFGSRLGPRESAMVDNMMASPPDQSSHVNAAAPQARTQIGNRTY